MLLFERAYNGKFKGKDIHYEVTKGGCWKCTSHSSTHNGYVVLFHKGKQEHMTRFIMREVLRHPLKDLHVLHTCDNRWCINPSHLFLGTNQDNIEDRVRKGRSPTGLNHWNGVLSHEDIEKIKALRARKATVKEISKLMGVTKSTIYKILEGKRHAGQKKKGEK